MSSGAEQGSEEGVKRTGEPFRLANEFAYVEICKVSTRNGDRLEITSPKLGYTILLDPVQLESLTWQTPETLSRLLEHPFGPGGAE